MNDRRETASDIAIIGMAGRFPGAGSVEALWQMLRAGDDAYEIVPEAVLARSIHRGIYKDPSYVPVTLPLKEYDRFDAGFFGYSAREAAYMEPQQRLLLECAWHAFEQAGHVPGDADGGRTAVFASTSASSYLLGHVMPHVIVGEADMLDATIGTDKDYAATRIAYRLGLHGPALAVQTACSSSLVATHLACQSLLSHECDAALVAACSLPLPGDIGYMHAAAGIRSRDGRCRPFDAQSSGTLFGAGVAAVLLRRYGDALADGDPIIAVIRGSAINNDGATRLGFTAPAIDGQVRVITEALSIAGVQPAEVGYIECHGTGTPIGDPVEISALQQAMQGAVSCNIGSIKSNIGHLDTVAGLAGLIKAALIVSRGELPAMATFSTPNPALRLETTPFRINTQTEAWNVTAEDRIAGVSSFGFGGTNAHVVLCSPPNQTTIAQPDRLRLLPLSAHDPESLNALCANIGGLATTVDISSLADSLTFDRKEQRYRRFAVAETVGEAARQLAGSGSMARHGHKLALLFPGQGSQFSGMAKGAADALPGYRTHLEEALKAFETSGRTDLRPYLLQATTIAGDCSTALAQAALFTTQYAIGRLLLDWGVLPDAMIGHSIGEYSAACLSGVFDLPTAVHLVCARGDAMGRCPPGAMVLVSLTEAEATDMIERLGLSLSIACCNTLHHTVLGGSTQVVTDFIQACAEGGISARRLETAHAFHTSDMATAVEQFNAAFSGCVLRAPRIPIVSTRTGQWLSSGEATDPSYWAGQLRDKVCFSDAVRALLDDGEWIFAETGAAGGLSGFVRSIRPQQTVVELLPGRGGVATDTHAKLLHGIGTLWQHGASLDWQAFAGPRLTARTALPLYPFRRHRHWLEPAYDRLMAAFESPLPDAPSGAPEEIVDTAAAAVALSATFAPRPRLDSDYNPPLGALEQQLTDLFEGVLYTRPIGRDDDFFSLGGQSILILDLVRRAGDVAIHLEPADLFENRTIAALAAAIEARTISPSIDTQPQNPQFDVDNEDLQRLLGMI